MIHVKELPFAGRADELHALTTFCNTTTEGDRLAVLWMEGEAGIGKSRLITEFVRWYTRDSHRSETIILETRLYQDSTVAPGWLIADALQTSASALNLLAEPVQPDIDFAVRALRRLTRLRPTILVLEDLHWLTDAGSEELARFLHSLREQPLAVLCTSRPGRHQSYTAATGFIADILHLPPLSAGDIHAILDAVPLPPNVGSPSLPKLLHTASHGIPLVLPGLIGELSTSPHDSGEALKTHIVDLSGRTRESVVAGLLSRLDDQERKAAITLAMLGEIFTSEAATILLGTSAEPVLKNLHEHRIVVHPLKPVSPLLGKTGAPENIWIFSHSLVHETLRKKNPASVDELTALVRSRTAIHSITPFLALVDSIHHTTVTDAHLTVLRQILEIADQLIKRSHLHAATQLLHRIEEVVNGLGKREQKKLNLLIADLHVNIASVRPFSAECREAVRKALALTEAPQTEEQARSRIRTLAYDIPSGRAEVFRSVGDRLQEIDHLTQRFPALLHSTELGTLLGLMTGQARIHPYAEHIRAFTAYFRKIDAAIGNGEGHVRSRTTLYLFGTTLLPIFSSAAELRARQVMAGDIMNWFNGDLPEQLRHNYVRFLTNAGLAEQARSYLDQLPPGYSRLLAAKYNLLLQKVFVDATLGAPLPLLEAQLRSIVARSHQEFSAAPHSTERTFPEIGSALCALNIARMRGENEWGEELAGTIAGTDRRVREQMQLNALAHYRLNQQTPVPSHALLPEPLVPVFALATCDAQTNRAQVRELLEAPATHIDQIFVLEATVAILQAHKSSRTGEPLITLFHSQAGEAFTRFVTWALENALVGFVPRLLEAGAPFFSGKALQQYAALCRKEQTRNAGKYGWDQEPQVPRKKITLTMIGTVTVKHGENGSQRIQGGKARRTLGLMTANELMRQPLPTDVFREIATGIAPHQGDPANALRQIVSRLRSLLGKDAIISDGQSPPRLNFNVITVDLIRIWEKLEETADFLRRKHPGNARQALALILATLGNEPVYPGLYGEFFDSARTEFEIFLRNQVLAVGQALCREGDIEGATSLLNQASELMPGDEEIAEELIALFNTLERPTEEFRIRQRWSRESEAQKEAA